MKQVLIFFTLISFSEVFGQQLNLIIQDNFDGNTGTWNQLNASSSNYLEIVTSNYSIENNSLQVINYASINPWSNYMAGYTFASSQASSIRYRYFNAQNYYNLELRFDWKCNGEEQKDFGSLLYSLDGVNWTTLKDYQSGKGDEIQTEILNLPKCIQNSGFYLGFSFTADNSFNFQPGLVVDNIKLFGTFCNSANTPNTPTNPSNMTVCYNDNQTVTLTAYTNAGNLRWYKVPWCEESFHQGINFQTLPLTTTKYYVTALNSIGCESANKLEINLVVKQLPQLTDTIIIEAKNGNDGSIATFVNGVFPLSYEWSLEGDSSFSAYSSEINNLNEGNYLLTITDGNNCQANHQLYLGTSADIIIPNGISPNLDGYNDVWILEGIQQWPDFNIEILNMRGDVLYRQSAVENGTYLPYNGIDLNGVALPEGDYPFVIKSNFRSKKYIGILSIKYD
jgi:gliding motility-associated-like protein